MTSIIIHFSLKPSAGQLGYSRNEDRGIPKERKALTIWGKGGIAKDSNRVNKVNKKRGATIKGSSWYQRMVYID
jgi:hypothetical protein